MDTAKSDKEDPMTLPIQLHLESAKMLQHGHIETGTNSAPAVDPTLDRESPSSKEENELMS